ncbi:MAG: hypothetical protein CM15mP84_04820 [Cellvibrionales bacterium]|nr:MAG: hypothetical protein CM15mP84_04820 [Cellvibrionales bacterium]
MISKKPSADKKYLPLLIPQESIMLRVVCDDASALKPNHSDKQANPAPIPIRKLIGILPRIHALNLVTLITTKRTPAINTAPNATFQV